MRKSFLIAIMFLLGHQAHAGVLLNCTLPDGDTIQATVIRTNKGLRLKEITTSRKEFVRILSENDWNQKRIRLIADIYPDARAWLYKSGSTWYFRYYSLGYDAEGVAICK